MRALLFKNTGKFVLWLLYFVIGIPLIGGRSFCTLICPLGYEIRKIVKFTRHLKKKF